MNTCSEDIVLALQELGFDIINVKQMKAKRPSPEGPITTVTFPLFCQKSQTISNPTDLRNTDIKVETYRAQIGLTHCYNCHIWVHCKQPPRCFWCGGGQRHQEFPEKENRDSLPKRCNCESQHPSSYRGCGCAKRELKCRKQQSGSQLSACRNIVSKLVTPGKTYAVAAAAATIPVTTPKTTLGHQRRLRQTTVTQRVTWPPHNKSAADHDRSEDITNRK
jgi:hypothetical protein